MDSYCPSKSANKNSLILCSWDHASQFYVTKCPTRCNYTQSILSVNCSTCFGWFLHPSSGAQITVTTASGTSQPLLLPVAIVEELRLSLNFSTIDTVICAPDDGWRSHSKHVEQFTDKINCV